MPRAVARCYAQLSHCPLLTVRPALSGNLRKWITTSATAANAAHHDQVIFSGIQPTGIPHLGNYLGALQQWVKMQNDAPASTTLLFSIVDLHSLTSNQTPAFRRQAKRELLATLLAVGLDPERSILFNQSEVPAHAELHWILSCDASMGYLSRMTQWKSKLSDDEVASLLSPSPNPKSQERMKLGLFSYPVLQAADILVHGATHVPVGSDQLQHVEFARYAAKQFNNTYAPTQKILIPPESITSQAKRVMSLTEPDKKMSKSHTNPRSRILLNDTAEQIAKKFQTALTDSEAGITYDPERRPGVANLIEILAHFDIDHRNCDEIATDLRNVGLKGLKQKVSDAVSSQLEPIREHFEQLMSDDRRLDRISQQGAERAQANANAKLKLVKDAVGL